MTSIADAREISFRNAMPEKKPDSALLGVRRLDLLTHAALARLSFSISPQSMALAVTDWATHLAASPGRQLQLLRLAGQLGGQLLAYAQRLLLADGLRAAQLQGDQPLAAEPPVQDRRFADPAWQWWPFNLHHQAFLLQQQWWEAATQDVWGVSAHHQQVVSFAARQCLDVFSPGNWLLTNPVVLQRTWREKGANLTRGLNYWLDDFQRLMAEEPPAGAERFTPGREVAVTPGKVVLRNRLMELIQYAPATAKTRPEPVLIVPAWIMKYYILDLSPHNSLVKYLVDQGHTVFCISWKNPDENDGDLGMDDCLNLGFRAALEAIEAIAPGHAVHAAGYCLGGTLLAIAAAALARDGQLGRLASMTLFAAQTDFSEPGELSLFIDESQIALLEAQMTQRGCLTGRQMAGAFQMLRSYDLLWSRLLGEYLLGERRPMNDLMAWNADTTRMPARMHAQYLRRLFLHDDLSEGRYLVDGQPVSLGALRLPVFCVGTVADHVAPWRSVFKLHRLAPAEITFVLTNGGHNAGIVSEPGHPRRHYQMLTRHAGGDSLTPDAWLAAAPRHEGSWWPAWNDWLNARSGKPAQPPRMGDAVADAPGQYVLQK